MKVTTQVFGVLLLGLTMAACKSPTYKKTKEGFPYTVFSDGKGDKIMPGNTIRFHQTSKLDDSLLGTSYGNDPQWLPIPKDGPGADRVAFFLDARKGDSILLIQPIDSIIAKEPRAAEDPFLKSKRGKQIKTWFKIVEVYKDDAMVNEIREKEAITSFYKDSATKAQKPKDEAVIEAYLKANNIATKRTPWGGYLQTLTPGNGVKPKLGQFLQVRYKGKLLSGEEFDSNTKPGQPPMEMQLGVTNLIIGFNDALQQMSKGEKAIVYLPSVIGYGAQGGQPNAQGVQVIKPNDNLIFELELIDVADKQAPPPPPMQPQDTTRK